MYLSKRSKGIYYVVYTTDNGKRTSKSTGCRNKTEAHRFLINFIKELENSKIKYKDIPFNEFRLKFLIYSETYHTWKTTLTYKSTFNSLEKYFGKNILLSDLTKNKIEEYIQHRIRNTSMYGARKDLINIKAFLNWAVNQELIPLNPAQKIPRVKPPEKLPKYFSREEFDKLIDVIDDELIRDIVIVAVNTGMRQREILNLRFDMIDMSNKLITLDNIGFVTKSKKVRSVPMNDKCLAIIEKRYNKKTSNLVFTMNNRIVYQDYVVHKFKKFVLSADINPKLNFHSLRHTFASWLVQKGVSIYIVSKLLGHADIKTTEIYSHLSLANFEDAVSIL